MSNRRQAIIWTNAGPIHRGIYAALGGYEFTRFTITRPLGTEKTTDPIQLCEVVIFHSRYYILLCISVGSKNHILFNEIMKSRMTDAVYVMRLYDGIHFFTCTFSECELGWFELRPYGCYALKTSLKSWYEWKRDCDLEDAVLMTLETRTEYTALERYLEADKGQI